MDIYTLSGPPGCGKSTILSCIADRGFLVLPESHRWLRLFQRIEMERAPHLAQSPVFPGYDADLHEAFELAREAYAVDAEAPLFLDRSCVDIYAFAKLYGSPNAPRLRAHAERFAPLVKRCFFVTREGSDVPADWLRMESSVQSREIEMVVKAAYAELGVPVTPIENTEVARSVETILASLEQTRADTS